MRVQATLAVTLAASFLYGAVFLRSPKDAANQPAKIVGAAIQAPTIITNIFGGRIIIRTNNPNAPPPFPPKTNWVTWDYTGPVVFFEIGASTDLVHWTSLTNTLITSNRMWTTKPKEFYRVRSWVTGATSDWARVTLGRVR